MKRIELSLKDFRFKATFIITTAMVERLKLALTSTSSLIDFGTNFANGDGNFLDEELRNLCHTKKNSTMQHEEFEQQALGLIFQHYYDENFENENFKHLITLVAAKFKLRRKITVLFAESANDLEHEAAEDPNFISNMDNTSSAIFPLFIATAETRPFETTKAIIALPRPVFFIPRTDFGYIETDNYTVDADVALFKKPWNSKATKDQVDLRK